MMVFSLTSAFIVGAAVFGLGAWFGMRWTLALMASERDGEIPQPLAWNGPKVDMPESLDDGEGEDDDE